MPAVPNQRSPDQFRSDLKKNLLEKYQWYDKGSRWWSTGYHFLLYSSAALSAAAALFTKTSLLKTHSQDVSAICAAVAALFTSYIAGGGFTRKWRANRIARGKIAQLLIDIDDPASDLPQIRANLKGIIQEEDEGIVGTG